MAGILQTVRVAQGAYQKIESISLGVDLGKDDVFIEPRYEMGAVLFKRSLNEQIVDDNGGRGAQTGPKRLKLRKGIVNMARLGQHLNDRIQSMMRRRREEEEVVVESVDLGEHFGADENGDDERERGEVISVAGEGALEEKPCQLRIVGISE